MKYLFGPVHSRRLGVSLGVDVVPFKTCSMDCVYCECGATTCLTTDVREWTPTEEIIAELTDYLARNPALDVITFSGGGEPTLHRGIGDIIAFLKRDHPRYRVVLLTNGSLFQRPEVRARVREADIIVPSLDAAGEQAFRSINRPAEGITAAGVIEGLVSLRGEFAGELCLEIFVVPGFNDTDIELARLRAACDRIRPDQVQLNMLDRPGTERWVVPAAMETMERVRERFAGYHVIITGRPRYGMEAVQPDDRAREWVLSILGRRPSTIDDIACGLGIGRERAQAIIDALVNEGRVERSTLERGEFFRLSRRPS